MSGKDWTPSDEALNALEAMAPGASEAARMGIRLAQRAVRYGIEMGAQQDNPADP